MFLRASVWSGRVHSLMRRFPPPPGLVSTGTVSVCQQVMQIPEIGVMQSYLPMNIA